MEQNKKKAILVVSFGTSFHETREKTIDCIEADLAAAYPEYTLYRAWTSKMIIAKLKKRDSIVVSTVSEAVDQMITDGMTINPDMVDGATIRRQLESSNEIENNK